VVPLKGPIFISRSMHPDGVNSVCCTALHACVESACDESRGASRASVLEVECNTGCVLLYVSGNTSIARNCRAYHRCIGDLMVSSVQSGFEALRNYDLFHISTYSSRSHSLNHMLQHTICLYDRLLSIGSAFTLGYKLCRHPAQCGETSLCLT
jgi:hypothetical protein